MFMYVNAQKSQSFDFQVKSVETASFAKVTPTSHNGSVELLQLQKRTIDKDSIKTWIDFQKVSFYNWLIIANKIVIFFLLLKYSKILNF